MIYVYRGGEKGRWRTRERGRESEREREQERERERERAREREREQRQMEEDKDISMTTGEQVRVCEREMASRFDPSYTCVALCDKKMTFRKLTSQARGT